MFMPLVFGTLRESRAGRQDGLRSLLKARAVKVGRAFLGVEAVVNLEAIEMQAKLEAEQKRRARRDLFVAAALTGIMANPEIQNSTAQTMKDCGFSGLQLTKKCGRVFAIFARITAESVIAELDNPTVEQA